MITLQDIRDARTPQSGRVDVTPLFPSRFLSQVCGGNVLLKAENLQRTGSFKIRGATNRIAHLSEEQRALGVVAASAGNHAQGVACAAMVQGVPATVYMPEEAPLIKVVRTRGFGARVELVEGAIEEAMEAAARLRDRDGVTFIHPFDDELIQAGQGTCGLEILEACPEVDHVIVPVGGGGLISGIAVAIKEQKPSVKIWGVQAEGADPAARSMKAGALTPIPQAVTMADGIRVRRIAASTFAVMQRYLEGVVTVSEEAIAEAMVLMLEDAKLVVEGAGAAGVAAAISSRLPRMDGTAVFVLCGGNADINMLSRVIQRGLSVAGRYVLLRVRIPDRPGYLKGILDVVARERANIVEIDHHRAAWRVPLGDVEVEMLLETRDIEHGAALRRALETAGLDVSEGPRAAP